MENQLKVRAYSRGVILTMVMIAGILLPRILPLKAAVYTNITSFLSIPGGFGWENMAENMTGQQMISPLFQIFLIVSLLIYVPVIVMAFAKPGGLALLILRILFALPGIAFLTCAFCQSLFLWKAIRTFSAGSNPSTDFVSLLGSLLMMLSFLGLATLCFVVGIRFRSRRKLTIVILDITALALVIQLVPVCTALWDVLNVQKQAAEAIIGLGGYVLFVGSLLTFIEIILLYHRLLSFARKRAAEAASVSEAQLSDPEASGPQSIGEATPLVWQPEGGGAASTPTFAAAQQQDPPLNAQPQQVFVQPMPQPTAQPQQPFTQGFGQSFDTPQRQPFMQPGQPVQQAAPAAYATPQQAPPLYPQPQQAAQPPAYAEAAQYTPPVGFAEAPPSQGSQAAPTYQQVYATPQPPQQAQQTAQPLFYTAPQQAQQSAPPVYTAPQQAQQPKPFIQPAQQQQSAYAAPTQQETQPAAAFSPQPQQAPYAESAQAMQEAPAPVWPTPAPSGSVDPETPQQHGPKPYPSSSW
jgi:hypothetical protein